MVKYLLEKGADPDQKLFTDGFYDDDNYERWLYEHMDLMLFDGFCGPAKENLLDITALLIQYGKGLWPGGICIHLDEERRKIIRSKDR